MKRVSSSAVSRIENRPVEFEAAGARLQGELGLPADPFGLVLFAHGSGSSRHSPRNRHVARLLQNRGLATFLFDLLTEQEGLLDATSAELRFDLPLLTTRLLGATAWARGAALEFGVRLGYFGSSTGAAAALMAAAAAPNLVAGIVSRGGRPDLAGEALREVRAPTLLIVGGNDEPVLTLNRYAFQELRCPKSLEIVPGATHLFEQSGALESVAELAGDWFKRHLPETP